MSAPITAQRLLAASASAYLVNLKGNFIIPKPNQVAPKPKKATAKPKFDGYRLYTAAHFQSKPQAFTNVGNEIKKKINAAILGETDIGNVLAFRGTLPPKKWNDATIEDWWQDIFEINQVVGVGLPGKVHSGFYKAFMSIWAQIDAALHQIYVVNKSTKPLYITGHSKGGPMASYAAFIISHHTNYPKPGIITFASPFPGNADFATIYDSQVSQIRYENYLDIVPFVPPNSTVVNDLLPLFDSTLKFLIKTFPSWKKTLKKFEDFIDASKTMDYTQVGTLQYITKDHDIEGDNLILPYLRALEFGYAMAKDGVIGGLKEIGDAHMIGYGGGYETGVIGKL